MRNLIKMLTLAVVVVLGVAFPMTSIVRAADDTTASAPVKHKKKGSKPGTKKHHKKMEEKAEKPAETPAAPSASTATPEPAKT